MNKELTKLLETLVNNPEVYKVKLDWRQTINTDTALGDIKGTEPIIKITKYTEINNYE